MPAEKQSTLSIRLNMKNWDQGIKRIRDAAAAMGELNYALRAGSAQSSSFARDTRTTAVAQRESADAVKAQSTALISAVAQSGKFHRAILAQNRAAVAMADTAESAGMQLYKVHTGLRALTMHLTTGIPLVDKMGYVLDKAAMNMWKFMIAAIPLERLSFSLAALSGILIGVVAWSGKTKAEFEKITAQFEAMGDGAEFAARHVEFLYRFAAETPFDVEQVARAGPVMLLMAQKTGVAFEEIAHAAATLAAGTAGMGHDIVRASLAMLQSLDGQHRRIRDTYHFTQGVIEDYVEGSVDSLGRITDVTEYYAGLVEAIYDRLGDVLDRQTAAMGGQWSMLIDEIKRLGVELGEIFREPIMKFIQFARSIVEWLRKIADSPVWGFLIRNVTLFTIALTGVGAVVARAAAGVINLAGFWAMLGQIVGRAGAPLKMMGDLHAKIGQANLIAVEGVAKYLAALSKRVSVEELASTLIRKQIGGEQELASATAMSTNAVMLQTEALVGKTAAVEAITQRLSGMAITEGDIANRARLAMRAFREQSEAFEDQIPITTGLEGVTQSQTRTLDEATSVARESARVTREAARQLMLPLETAQLMEVRDPGRAATVYPVPALRLNRDQRRALVDQGLFGPATSVVPDHIPQAQQLAMDFGRLQDASGQLAMDFNDTAGMAGRLASVAFERPAEIMERRIRAWQEVNTRMQAMAIAGSPEERVAFGWGGAYRHELQKTLVDAAGGLDEFNRDVFATMKVVENATGSTITRAKAIEMLSNAEGQSAIATLMNTRNVDENASARLRERFEIERGTQAVNERTMAETRLGAAYAQAGVDAKKIIRTPREIADSWDKSISKVTAAVAVKFKAAMVSIVNHVQAVYFASIKLLGPIGALALALAAIGAIVTGIVVGRRRREEERRREIQSRAALDRNREIESIYGEYAPAILASDPGRGGYREETRKALEDSIKKRDIEAKGATSVLGRIGMYTAAGAGIGAMIGSIIPVIGTAIGAIIGGIAGLITGIGQSIREALRASGEAKESKELLRRMEEVNGTTEEMQLRLEEISRIFNKIISQSAVYGDISRKISDIEESKENIRSLTDGIVNADSFNAIVIGRQAFEARKRSVYSKDYISSLKQGLDHQKDALDRANAAVRLAEDELAIDEDQVQYKLLLNQKTRERDELLKSIAAQEQEIDNVVRDNAQNIRVINQHLRIRLDLIRSIRDTNIEVWSIMDRMYDGYTRFETAIARTSSIIQDQRDRGAAMLAEITRDPAAASEAFGVDVEDLGKFTEELKIIDEIVAKMQRRHNAGEPTILTPKEMQELNRLTKDQGKFVIDVARSRQSEAEAMKEGYDRHIEYHKSLINLLEREGAHSSVIEEFYNHTIRLQEEKILGLVKEFGFSREHIVILEEEIRLRGKNIDRIEAAASRLRNQASVYSDVAEAAAKLGYSIEFVTDLLYKQEQKLRQHKRLMDDMGREAEAARDAASIQDISFRRLTYESSKTLDNLQFQVDVARAMYGENFNMMPLYKRMAWEHLNIAAAARKVGNMELERKHTLEAINLLYKEQGDLLEEIFGEGPGILELFGYRGVATGIQTLFGRRGGSIGQQQMIVNLNVESSPYFDVRVGQVVGGYLGSASIGTRPSVGRYR